MKKWILFMMFGSIFILAGFGKVYAQDEDEKKMVEVSARVDTESHEPGDAKKVEARLEKEFDVTDARIGSLRQKGLGYGEISIALSLAKQFPGGINVQNMQ